MYAIMGQNIMARDCFNNRSLLALCFFGFASSLVFPSANPCLGLGLHLAEAQWPVGEASSCGAASGHFSYSSCAWAREGFRSSEVMALAPAFVVTLDLPEPQVLVNRPGDPNGEWHHYLLLKRMQPGTWVGLSPTLALDNLDLNALPHVVLERLAPFPAAQANETLAHDLIGKAALESFKRRAVTTAAILGEGDMNEIDYIAWHIAEAEHKRFGEEIDPQLLANAATGLAFTRKGVILLNGEEVFVERIYATDLEGWKASRGTSKSDDRLNAIVPRPSTMKVSLAVAFEGMSGPGEKDLPLQGEYAAMEFLGSVVEGAGNLAS